MRRTNFALILVLSLSVLLAVGCSHDRTGTTARNGAMSNSDVEQMVKQKFNSDPQLSAADIKVSADADHNQIKLSGTVPSEDLRARAIDVARSVQPDATVTDTIDVKPREMARTEEQGSGEPTGRQDQDIRAQVESKINSDPALAADNLKIDVSKDNIVTLKGDVKSGEEKARAQKLAQSIDGVAQVRNDLKVKSR